MTLELYVGDTAPGGTGTYLYNSSVLDIKLKSKNVVEKATSVTGKPIVRWIGETHEMNFILLVEEKADHVSDATHGLTDIEVIRKWSIGWTTTIGHMSWIRDIEGEYFLRDWKACKPSGIQVIPVQGYPNVVGTALYRVTFKIQIMDDSTDAYTFFRWDH